jgi:signal transduction histidine kinase/DNA-binding response OmpR family regulator
MDILADLETERRIRNAAQSLRSNQRQTLKADIQGLGLRMQALGQQIDQDANLIFHTMTSLQELGQTGRDLHHDATARLQALLTRRRAQIAQTPQTPLAKRPPCLAQIAHEIRTPLTGVVGLAQLVADTPLTDDQRLLVETIKSSASAALGIADDILTLGKIDAAGVTILAQPFDLEALIHEVLLLMLPLARAKGVRLLIDYDPNLPAEVIGDAAHLRQVLTNLANNAVKFTTQGHVVIRVMGVEATIDAGPDRHISTHHVQICVEDTGIGMAPQDLALIFDPYHQIDTGTDHGAGLGLWIAKRLVEGMGGTIWADSDLGGGTSFGLRLPLRAEKPMAMLLPPQGLRRVLVIDENPTGRAILDGQLRLLGIAVTLCHSARDAVDILKLDQGFDAVLTDHEVDGSLFFVDKIRAQGAFMPILLMCDDAAERRSMARGLAGLVQRPIRRADLYRQLHSLHKAVPPDRTESSPKTRLPRPMRILAAEDNRTNQLVFQKMVRDLAIDLAFANTGREAVHLVQSFNPDLVFMDIAMPEMDGCEAAVAIRQSEAGGARLPIIALTAHAEGAELAPLLAAGIDRRMTKPLQKAALRDVMIEFCPKAAYVLPPKAELTQAGA